MYKRYFKRIFDVTLSLTGLICLSPVLLVLYVLVRVKLGSPVFFRQLRIGKNDKPFMMIKFRTMTDTRGEDGELLPDTERFTKFGDFLRRSSLDELPELFNVLKGDMSLIGPRPLYPIYLPYYTREEERRHSVRGGITGLAQINGRALCRWKERFAYDVQYVDTLSFTNDVKILWRTFFKVAAEDDIGTPSVTDEGGLHIIRQVQQPEKVELVNHILAEYKKH
ncbi:MAG: sugar transferase [Muribaculaceae bacterium]